jgi:hypothetical protein
VAEFTAYLNKGWVNEKGWRWQCFHTASGYATTNNPWETFNAAIKRDVTMRQRLKVGALVDQLMILCAGESSCGRSAVPLPRAP